MFFISLFTPWIPENTTGPKDSSVHVLRRQCSPFHSYRQTALTINTTNGSKSAVNVISFSNERFWTVFTFTVRRMLHLKGNGHSLNTWFHQCRIQISCTNGANVMQWTSEECSAGHHSFLMGLARLTSKCSIHVTSNKDFPWGCCFEAEPSVWLKSSNAEMTVWARNFAFKRPPLSVSWKPASRSHLFFFFLFFNNLHLK